MPSSGTKQLSEQNARRCADLIQKADSIAVLTGAGISTSAGIPDFRGPQGLYVTRQYDPEKVFDINYFLQDPEPFYQFARDFVGLEQKLSPSPAHKFFGELEEKGKLKGVITQNIDGLHQRAGAQGVFELHGSFKDSYCLECGKHFSYLEMQEKLRSPEVPQCCCEGLIKPDIVFFGEDVKFLDEAYLLAESVDLFFVVGTACVVYPAASVPHVAKGDIVVVNKGVVHISPDRITLDVQEDIDGFFEKVRACLNY